ncbi:MULTISPECIES: PEP-CTERM sorting domain-containing protein [unclassified Phenylobacterium]|uniref:PEP-CTERM sorting domain-containing protein n=1 Tax=unclassified Phenylobacterium TaxID=2640670 RepID=UPI00083B4832|nr:MULTISPECIES: PEP-CTERM sorting domain-containing protein [unclassified Phenylobacterium]
MRLRSTLAAAAFTLSLAMPALADTAGAAGQNTQGSIVAPEPVGWGLMILGFGAAGAMLRLRRRRAPA